MALEQLLGEQAVKEIKGREFGINPNSRYSEKEFLERAEDLLRVDASYSKIIQNGGDIAALIELAGIATKYMPGDKGENMKILKDPIAAVKQARLLLDSGYKNMADYTARNLDSFLREMPEEVLIETAAILPDKNKLYAQIAQYMQVGDMKSARKVYAETFEGEDWKKFIITCPNAEFIQHQMKIDVDYMKRKFINRNLSIQVKDNKEQTYKPDLNKAREYIARTIAGYSDKERQIVYRSIAMALYNSKKCIEKKEEDEEELMMAA